MMKREYTSGCQVLTHAQSAHCGVEHHCAADVHKIRLYGAANPGTYPCKRCGLERARNGADMKVLGEVGTNSLAVSQRTHREDIHGASRLAQTVGWLEKIAGIFRDGLLQPVATAWCAIAGRHDDHAIKLAREFVQRRRPRADLATGIRALGITERADK